MKTLNSKRIWFLDYAKWCAILCIIFFHIFWYIPNLSHIQQSILLGWGVGVHLFLFLSGFWLTLQAKKYAMTAWEFYKKQVWKVYVPYVFVVICSACLAFFIPEITEIHSRYAFFGHLLGYKMFDETIIESYGIHFWFISTLLQFYVLYPFLYLTSIRRPRAFLPACFILSIIRIIFLNSSPYLGLGNLELDRVWKSFFLQYIWEFWSAIVIAQKWEKYSDIFERSQWFTFIAFGVCALGIYAILSYRWWSFWRTINDVRWLIWFGCLCLGVYRLCTKTHTIMEYIGRWSYSIYLFHWIILISSMAFLDMVGLTPTRRTQSIIFVSAVVFWLIWQEKIIQPLWKYTKL